MTIGACGALCGAAGGDRWPPDAEADSLAGARLNCCWALLVRRMAGPWVKESTVPIVTLRRLGIERNGAR